MSPDYDMLLDRALEAFDAKDYLRARGLFEQAFAIRPNARILRGLGISALHLERFSVSKRELTQALSETKQPLTLNQREGVRELLTWMQLNLGTLRLQLQPAHAHVLLDDQPVDERELVLKPGTHRVHVSADNFVSQAHTVEIAAGKEETLALTLPKEAVAGAPASTVIEPDVVVSTFFVGSGGSLRDADQPPPRDSDSASPFESWWFWTAVGVVIAGGVATTVALTSDTPEKKYERGGLGGVLRPLEWRP
jgi:hypothetical protein